jgi:hypothetical protein
MSMIDLLLAADASKLTELPTEELEVSRLSNLFGQKFLITVKALTLKQIEALPRGEDHRLHAILEATIDPDFRDQQLAKKFTPPGRKALFTPVEVINHLFLPGEIFNIFTVINELSGYGEETVRKLEKN